LLFTSADDLHLKLKVEINTREHQAFAEPVAVPFSVETDWFQRFCDVPTFCREEMLATKLRALLQRNKGRDVIDISHALKTMPDLNDLLIVDVFNCYIHLANQSITRAQAKERMFQKLAKPMLLSDVKPLLRADEQISCHDYSKTDFWGFTGFNTCEKWSETFVPCQATAQRDLWILLRAWLAVKDNGTLKS
jgi:hypothetical protein